MLLGFQFCSLHLTHPAPESPPQRHHMQDTPWLACIIGAAVVGTVVYLKVAGARTTLTDMKPDAPAGRMPQLKTPPDPFYMR